MRKYSPEEHSPDIDRDCVLINTLPHVTHTVTMKGEAEWMSGIQSSSIGNSPGLTTK